VIGVVRLDHVDELVSHAGFLEREPLCRDVTRIDGLVQKFIDDLVHETVEPLEGFVGNDEHPVMTRHAPAKSWNVEVMRYPDLKYFSDVEVKIINSRRDTSRDVFLYGGGCSSSNGGRGGNDISRRWLLCLGESGRGRHGDETPFEFLLLLFLDSGTLGTLSVLGSLGFALSVCFHRSSEVNAESFLERHLDILGGHLFILFFLEKKDK